MVRKRNESEKTAQSYIPFPVIAKAVNGDSDAITTVTTFYENYIRSFCHRRAKESYGENTYYFDEALYQILKSKLVESVLLKFSF